MRRKKTGGNHIRDEEEEPGGGGKVVEIWKKSNEKEEWREGEGRTMESQLEKVLSL